MHRSNHSQGKAILELAMVLPIVVLLVLGALDAYQAFHNFQYLAVVVREIGNAVSRNCTPLNNDGVPAGTTAMSSCVGPYVLNALNFVNAAGGALPGVQVIVKVYRVNDPAATPTLAGGFNSGGAPGITSRYDDAAIEGLRSYRQEKGTIVTTEAFFTQDTFIPHFPGRYYETSVY